MQSVWDWQLQYNAEHLALFRNPLNMAHFGAEIDSGVIRPNCHPSQVCVDVLSKNPVDNHPYKLLKCIRGCAGAAVDIVKNTAGASQTLCTF